MQKIDFKGIYDDKNRLDSIVNLPIDEYEMNLEFAPFDYQILDRNMDTIRIVNKTINDTIILEMSIFPIQGGRSIVRRIGYFK